MQRLVKKDISCLLLVQSY